MLMTKYIFIVQRGLDGYLHTVVTRLDDGKQKYFFQCGGSVEGLTNHLNSMTDDLMESNFPRADKKGKVIGDIDNWKYLGVNPGRVSTEAQARMDLTHARLSRNI